MKKIVFLMAGAIFSSAILTAQSFTALYSFDSVKTTSGLTDPTPVPTATGVTFGSFSATGTPANPNAAARFSFTGWALDPSTPFDDVYSSLTGAINTSEYYEVTVSPLPGFTMTLASITFKAQRSGTGIRTYSVCSSADAYASNLSASINPANTKLSVQTGNIFFWNIDTTTTGQTGSTITLSGTDFTNSTSSVTFRFYAWNAEATGGSFGIDNVSFNGSVTGTTSIKTASNLSSFLIYPNPTTDGLFTIENNSLSSHSIYTISNLVGKIIYSKEIESSNFINIDLSNEANGIYFLNIKNDSGSSTKKITINK